MDSQYRDRSSDLLPPPSNGLPWTFQGMCTWVATNRLWAAERYAARKVVIRNTSLGGQTIAIDANGKSVLVSKTARNERKVIAYTCARFFEMLSADIPIHQAMEGIIEEVESIANSSEPWDGASEFLATIPTTPWQSRIASMKLAALVMIHAFFAEILIGISYGVWGFYYACSLFAILVFVGMTVISSSWLISTILLPLLLKFIHACHILSAWVLNLWQDIHSYAFVWHTPKKAFLGAYLAAIDDFRPWASSLIKSFNILGFNTPLKSISKRTRPFDEFVSHTSNATMHIANASFNMLPLSLFLRTSSYSITHAVLALRDWNSTEKWELLRGITVLDTPMMNLGYTLERVEDSTPYVFQIYRNNLDRIVIDIEELIADIDDEPSTIASQMTLASYTIWALSFPFVWRYPVPFYPEYYRLNNFLNYLGWTILSDQLGCLGSDGLFSSSYFKPSNSKPSGFPRFGCAPIQTIAAGMGYMTPEDYYHHICRAKQLIDRRMVRMTEYFTVDVEDATKDINKAIKEAAGLHQKAKLAIDKWRTTTGGLKAKIEEAMFAIASNKSETYWTGWFTGQTTREKEKQLRELNRWEMDQDGLEKIGIWVGQASQGLRDILLILEDIHGALSELSSTRTAFDSFGELSDAGKGGENKEGRKFSREWRVLTVEVLTELRHLRRMLKSVRINQAKFNQVHDEYLKARTEELERQEALELDCRTKGRIGGNVFTDPDEVACLMDGLGAFSLRTDSATTTLKPQETEAAS